ncbi:hypothetical protein [Streptomyces cacaoi]|uniref:Uncharacterized protein n=1 Tax=Streptomyces cacaoi TaxID=1898 RepID=A0A4Y3R9K5_STRCI|nr:hypothetical protein [Streptomyces cacaoi]GEB54381.1 hypothetical protein SCA03_69320 [Streptomyces cacaoi]
MSFLRAKSMARDLLGRLDERWYWTYQWALCALDADPRLADAMYERSARRHLATCGRAANPRDPRGRAWRH